MKKPSFKKIFDSILFRIGIVGVVLAIFFGIVTSLSAINIPPFRAFNGAIWFKGGIHYISDEQITSRIDEVNAPKQAEIIDKIKSSTPLCESVEKGYCQKSSEDYVYKTVITPAVAYKPGTPDREEITGYCTLCRDGTFSPSCAVGRGACSWHGGVASYGVPKYRIIPGVPEVQARPAVCSYATKSYTDSPIYIAPDTPTLNTIVGY